MHLKEKIYVCTYFIMVILKHMLNLQYICKKIRVKEDKLDTRLLPGVNFPLIYGNIKKKLF